MIPFFDLSRTHGPLEPELTDAFRRVVGHGRFILGPEVESFERAFAEWVGVAHAVGVSSGTDALLATLMALGIGPGDEVIVPTFTFFATAGTVARLGATPRFADVQPGSLLIDPDHALGLRTERTRCVIVVHLFGQCADIRPYRDAGLPVIEDAAQAHGSTDARGVPAGAQSEVACFSFFPTKPLGGFGDAGAVTTNDPALADRLRLVRAHGARPKFHHLRVGGNFRLDALQAALLATKIPYLHGWADERRAVAAAYRAQLGPVVQSGDLRFLDEVAGTHVYHQHVVRVRERDRLHAALARDGIGSALYYPEPLHIQPCFGGDAAIGDCPHAEAACAEALAIPCFPGLTEGEIATITQAIRRFYGQ